MSPASPTLAVVILNWNGLNLLREYLPGVIRHSKGPGIRIYVADNASSDGSVEFVRNTYPEDVTVLQNEGNFGYAKGYNVALRSLEEDYFVLLNSDVEVTGGWIPPVLALMESDPAIAACQPKLLDYRRRDTFEYAGAAGGFLDYLGYPFCRGRIFDAFEKDEGQYDDTRMVAWASGAALFIRSAVFRQAGGLEEDFFAHMEEIDLCWRIRKMGFEIAVCPDSVVYHLGGGTLNKVNPKKTYLNFRNNRLMITKNIGAGKLAANIIVRNLLDIAAGLQALAYGKFGESLAIFRALVDYHLLLPRWLKKRRQLRASLQTLNTHRPGKPELYKRSVVFLYFIKGIKKFSDLP